MRNAEKQSWVKPFLACVLVVIMIAAPALIYGLSNGKLAPAFNDYESMSFLDENGEPVAQGGSYAELSKFESFEDLKDFFDVQGNSTGYSYLSLESTPPTLRQTESFWEKSIGDLTVGSYMSGGNEIAFEGDQMALAGMDSGANAPGISDDHSDTNVQVEGVDEGDIVKNDARYAYIVTKGRNVVIVDAYPVDGAKVVSTIELDGRIQEIYVSNELLIVIQNGLYVPEPSIMDMDYGYWTNNDETYVKVYDIEERDDPKMLRNVGMKGYFTTSRMIGEHLYVITEVSSYSIYNESCLPCPADEIYYFNETDTSYQFTSFLAWDLDEIDEAPKKLTILMGYSHTIYVSTQHIYVTYSDWDQQFFEDGSWESEDRTIIHKLAIEGDEVVYVANGSVPGTVLNRFSMDEYNGYFRVATTTGWMEKNQVYVLSPDLDIVGSIEDIAPGERIYSARFMGNRAYLVTFKQVDPFFVIDLSNPYNPEILGELKIPGFSNYLHPYDENHVIGIGKDTVDAGSFAWFQGVKISLFDVTDVHNPIELDKFMIIGDRGTESLALDDPHAFLFSKEKNMLVIPISLYETEDDDSSPNTYGYFTWEGAYVLDISTDGIELRGRVTHDDGQSQPDEEYSYYYYGSTTQVKRSFYIGEVLYTVSDSLLKANDLTTLEELKKIDLG